LTAAGYSGPRGTGTAATGAPTARARRAGRAESADLTTAPFRPPLYDTFAIVTRAGARLPAGERELLADVEAHMRAVAEQLDR
jgi:hypothetical protein